MMHIETIKGWFKRYAGPATLLVIAGVVLGMIAFGVMS